MMTFIKVHVFGTAMRHIKVEADGKAKVPPDITAAWAQEQVYAYEERSLHHV
jgi:hypothetical protein